MNTLRGRPLSSPRGHRISRRPGHGTMTLVVALICTVVAASPTATPAAAAGGSCASDVSTAELNRVFAGQIDEYVGLDSLRVFPLPDGRVLWLFQDAFFSPTGAPVTNLGDARFAHNAALVQEGACWFAVHGPTSPADRCPNSGRASYVGGALTVDCTRWFWPMGGAMGADGYLTVFYALIGNANRTGAAPGAAPDGVWIARIDPATLAVASFTPAPDERADVLFGWSVENDATHSYLFGNSYDQFDVPDHGSPPPSYNYLARVPLGRFDLVPEYWNGGGWTTDRAQMQPVLVGSTSGAYSMQPRLVDGVWVSVTKIGDWFGKDLAIDTAPAPQGPWTRLRTMALPTKTLDGSTNNYLPHLLPWRSSLGNLVVTVSHNAWDMRSRAFPDPYLYRPTFFEVEPPPSMPSTTLAPTSPALGFVASAPVRAIDTRASAVVGAGETLRVLLAGTVSPDAAVAAVDIVGVGPQGNGFITAWSCDAPRPWVSNLNLTAGVTQAAFALVALSATQEICVFTSTTAHVVVDVFGAYQDAGFGGSSSFSTAGARRLIDTRDTVGRREPWEPLHIAVDPDATAVALNIAATEPAAPGFVTVYPCDQPLPTTSNLNVQTGQTLSNYGQVAVSAAGEVCVVTSMSTHVVIDLVGSFSGDPAGAWYRSTTPVRLVDSRVGIGTPVGPITRSEPGVGTVPANSYPALTAVPDSATALVVNAVAVDPIGSGWLTVAPCADDAAYGTVALNASSGRTTANLTVVPTPAVSGRDVCMYSMMPAHQVLDLSGWYEPA